MLLIPRCPSIVVLPVSSYGINIAGGVSAAFWRAFVQHFNGFWVTPLRSNIFE